MVPFTPLYQRVSFRHPKCALKIVNVFDIIIFPIGGGALAMFVLPKNVKQKNFYYHYLTIFI